MKLQCFSVHDKASGAFLPPFYGRARGEAIRAFTSACGDGQHQFSKSLGDYVLYYCGEFDDGAGIFIPVEPQRIISGLELGSPDSQIPFDK